MRASLILVLATSCGTPGPAPQPPDAPLNDQPQSAPEVLPEGVEAVSLLGENLVAPPLDEAEQENREEKLAAARTEYERNASSVDALVWVARRTAYLGRYREAIEIYTHGIETHPDEPRLYRHRGHRYITTRRFAEAIADLERAAELSRGKPDAVEIDGLPNPAGIPTGTQHGNTYYHLGLAHFLVGGYERARDAYELCLGLARTDDMVVAASYWLYLTLRRLGEHDAARRVLDPISSEMTIHENHAYHRLLLLYRGERSVEQALGKDPGAIEEATAGFGVASWQRAEGRAAEADKLLGRTLETPQWAAFGYIAAEADVARARRGND